MPEPASHIIFLADNHYHHFLSVSRHPVVKAPATDSVASLGVQF